MDHRFINPRYESMDGLFAVKVTLEELALKKSVTSYVAILFIIICITTIATHTLSLVVHTVGVIQVLKSSYSYSYWVMAYKHLR